MREAISRDVDMAQIGDRCAEVRPNTEFANYPSNFFDAIILMVSKRLPVPLGFGFRKLVDISAYQLAYLVNHLFTFI